MGGGPAVCAGDATAVRWVKHWRETGSFESRSVKGQSRSPLKKHVALPLELMRQEPDLTLEEIQRRLLDERQQTVELGSVWRFSTALTAPRVIDGPMNGNAFLAYVEQVLAPTLKPGNVVVLDNLSAAGMDEAVEAAGARLLYLPPYSGVNNFAFFDVRCSFQSRTSWNHEAKPPLNCFQLDQ